MQQTIAKGDVLQRLAGISFIVGAIVSVIFNILYPRSSEATLENVQPLLQEIAEAGSTVFRVDNLLLAVGLWALMIGWVGIYRSISTGGAATWARLGFYGVILGTTLWTVTFAMQMGFGLVAEQWAKAAATAKAAWLPAASALGMANFMLFSMTVTVYWLALLFMGIGMALSTLYPKWAGWALILLGALTVVLVGLPQVFGGLSQVVTNLLFPILSMLTLLWALVVGIWIARKAW